MSDRKLSYAKAKDTLWDCNFALFLNNDPDFNTVKLKLTAPMSGKEIIIDLNDKVVMEKIVKFIWSNGLNSNSEIGDHPLIIYAK